MSPSHRGGGRNVLADIFDAMPTAPILPNAAWIPGAGQFWTQKCVVLWIRSASFSVSAHLFHKYIFIGEVQTEPSITASKEDFQDQDKNTMKCLVKEQGSLKLLSRNALLRDHSEAAMMNRI
jgi:hypothetical protein